MFEYFPDNYVWNLAVVGTLNNGGTIGEVDEACRPILEASRGDETVGTAEFLASWSKVADRLVTLAEDDEARGRLFSAADKYRRAALYLLNAERMQGPDGDRIAVYSRAMTLQHKAIELSDSPVQIVEVPYEGGVLPAYFWPAPGSDRQPAPVVVQWNGFDSFKEQMLGSRFPEELARRGVSTLMVDQPGTGGALRLHGIHAVPDAERAGTACLEYLLTRPEVDPDRIGIVGWSLGGYYAPRAAAFEKRYALCVAWGANHNWGHTQRRRLDREGENPVPHYWKHALWVWGCDTMEEFENLWERITLDGVVEQIEVPFLITHGENDRQIPVADAYQSYEQAVASPKRELRIFTDRDGGVEHVHLDAMDNATHFIADWVAETFTELGETSTATTTPTTTRRVVTGHDDAGVSGVLLDGAPSTVTRLPHDGVSFVEVWSTATSPAIIGAHEDDPVAGAIHIPPPAGGTRIRVNEFAPGFLREGRQSPWHRTESVDYGIVIDGEVTLLLEDGEVTLRAGDVVVQRGTVHAWANRGDSVARVAFVLVDGRFDAELAERIGQDAITEAAEARTHVVTAEHGR